MAATLGADVELCAPLGGESGRVLRALIEVEKGRLFGLPCANGVYIHDRRSGARVEVATSLARPLRRHDLDELYGIALTTALGADVVLLTGPQPPEAVDSRLYRRLSRDLRNNSKLVIADLTGPALSATLEAGIDLLKISVEELIAEGYAKSDALPHLVDGMHRLHQAGALSVVLSRAALPTHASCSNIVQSRSWESGGRSSHGPARLTSSPPRSICSKNSTRDGNPVPTNDRSHFLAVPAAAGWCTAGR